jgi:hypothetical protein
MFHTTTGAEVAAEDPLPETPGIWFDAVTVKR